MSCDFSGIVGGTVFVEHISGGVCQVVGAYFSEGNVFLVVVAPDHKLINVPLHCCEADRLP